MKKKIAALLRRWAYALSPETPATLPPGYQVAKIVSYDDYAPKDGKTPDAELSRIIKGKLEAEVIEQVIGGGYIRTRTDIAAVPGGLIEYEASLYVGFIPKRTNNNKPQ